MSDDPFTPAELEAACKAVHELEDDTTERYLSVRFEVAAALRAVAPLIAARVRAEVAEEIAQAIANQYGPDPSPPRPAWWHGYTEAQRDSAAIARAHRTTPGDDHAH